MASSRRIQPDYGEDPRGLPAASPSRGAFAFPARRVEEEELVMEFLSTICVYFMVFGLAFLAVGAAAIVLPVVFVSISVPQLVAWMLFTVGLVSFLQFCCVFDAPGTTAFLMLAILHLAIGVWLLIEASARAGVTFLWIMLAWFLVHGMVKLAMGYELRSIKAWPALVVSGATSIVLGIMSMTLVPTFGQSLLGVIFGVDLIVTAFSILLISLAAYQVAACLSSSRMEPLLEQREPF